MKEFVVSLIFSLLQSGAGEKAATSAYPVPVPPGGRMDVHGWLILPMEQPQPAVNSPSSNYSITAWFSHHVPELFFGSPHNFQIILKGRLNPMSCVAGEVFPFEIPYPPENDMLVNEYSFTPPSPFSLNDLLRGDITHLRGVYYNGSFDTPYERQAMALASLDIEELTTATYLNEYEKEGFDYLQYLSYPRGEASSTHFYFAHEIRMQPDFDHVVHGIVSECVGQAGLPASMADVHTPGLSWVFPGVENVLENKLVAGQTIHMLRSGDGSETSCLLSVLESLHCMIGPGFMDNC